MGPVGFYGVFAVTAKLPDRDVADEPEREFIAFVPIGEQEVHVSPDRSISLYRGDCPKRMP